ncbi:hypothetical protein IHQ68_13165 [Chelatococcus sambhunathii]|uniref:Uncharacterized protein n=1 Tax=Chelatococcus sambhunathii TaxID=363953 RepID=A0ABU1DHG2_9HYPH|nr:hypothetical protein [Chelatococcus sambhunathii]MDR4307568.1 hypothetical protein [Chelatococcus sambhunathii]
MIASTRANLVTLVTAPTVWALHFLVCYVTASVHCAKALPDARVFTGDDWPDTTLARLLIAVATLAALAAIAWSSRQAWGHWSDGDAEPPFDDRQQFLGFATILLCGLSFIGVIFVALPAVFIGDCR